MKQMLKDWGLALIVGFAVFFFADVLGRRTIEHGEAPAFELEAVEGGTLSLASLKGKVVVINFWATWCGPCREEIPAFARWHTKNPGVAMVGLAVRSGDARVVAADAARLGITWPVALADDAVIDAYGIDVFPTTIIVNPEGEVVTTARGAIREADLERLVASAR